MRTFVIAEAAACHDGSLANAVRLVKLAADIGADAVKFQWCSNPTKLAQRRNAHEYLQAYQHLKFQTTWFPVLKGHADSRGLEFMCTVYLKEDIEVVEPYISRFKIASFEAGDREFLLAHQKYDKEIITSLGMGQEADPYLYVASGFKWLYCVSAYPTPPEQMNLCSLWGEYYHGVSDHTQHFLTGALAVAAGAQIIEFHYRLDETSSTNADFRVARRPADAKEYVDLTRQAEILMGYNPNVIRECEKPMMKYRVVQ